MRLRFQMASNKRWGNIDQWGVDRGHISEPYGINLQEFMVIGAKAHKIHKVPVHTFKMGDVEDPDLYAAQPLCEWQDSEMGKWIMERSIETPKWYRQHDHFNYGYQYAIEAFLKGADYSFWVLKWGNEVDRKNTFSI